MHPKPVPSCLSALLCTALLLAAGAWPFPAFGDPAPSGAAAEDDARCDALRDGRRLTYRNARHGMSMTYPSVFILDPGSVPANGDSAQFRTADGRATAVVTSLPNGMRQSLPDLLREARRDIVENSHGTITYERARDDWFVISGFVAGRIFYRRTFLAQGGGSIATLWLEFPPDLRPCLDEAVTTMSLSFKAMPQ